MKSDSNKKYKVLIGATGKLSSTVAAYLLKKQGHDVVALGVQFFVPNEESDTDEDGNVLYKPTASIFKYNLEDLNSVKAVYDSLEIPFYAANAQDIYKAKIMDAMVAARLEGKHFTPDVYITDLLIDTLLEKAKVIKADKIATGHYAKLIDNLATGELYLIGNQDVENDQSFLLSRISQKKLSQLMLPLSDMRKIEVEKIVKTISGEVIKPQKPNVVFTSKEFTHYVDHNIPHSMIKEGEIINYVDESLIVEHEGYHRYYVGQKEIVGRVQTSIDKGLSIAEINPSKAEVFLTREEDESFSHVRLADCYITASNDISKPQDGYVKFGPSEKKIPCTVFFKNNGAVTLDFRKKIGGRVPKGIYCVVYEKEGAQSKILVSGVVTLSYYLEYGVVKTLPKKNTEMEESEDDINKKKIKMKIGF